MGNCCGSLPGEEKSGVWSLTDSPMCGHHDGAPQGKVSARAVTRGLTTLVAQIVDSTALRSDHAINTRTWSLYQVRITMDEDFFAFFCD
jgi:hypothetical protein